MPDDPITIDEQIAEIEREIKLRDRVYPRWTEGPKPKLSPAAAERQMARLRAALATLVKLKQQGMAL